MKQKESVRRCPPAALNLLWLLVIYLLFAWFTDHARWLGQWRWDITEERLYTLSPGMQRILARIEEPIQLRLFYSPRLTRDNPGLWAYKQRVEKLLEQMQSVSEGRLQVIPVLVEPFSRQEDLAFAHGLQPVPGSDPAQAVFFGMSGTNALDGLDALSFLDPDQEPFLEYRLAQMIENLLETAPRQVAMLSALSDDQLWNRTEGRGLGVALYPLRHDYRLRRLSLPLQPLSPEIDVLLLLHPPALDETSARIIGDYLLQGGKLLAFVDPAFLASSKGTGSTSDINRLSRWLGVEIPGGALVADRSPHAESPSRDTSEIAPLLFAIRPPEMSQEDILTRNLSRLNLAAVGAWRLGASSPENMPVVLLRSSAHGRLVLKKDQQTSEPDLNAPLPMALRLTARNRGDGITHDAVPGGVVVVSDVDMLTNQHWVRSRQDMPRPVYLALADNGIFFKNALDHLSGSADLIGIPPRHHADRPFTRVESIRRQSEKKFRQTEQYLIAQLLETERTLNQWQQGKSSRDKMILTPEQQREWQRFRQVKLDIREKLRAVRRNYDQDVKRLGYLVLAFNLLFTPLLLGAAAFVTWRFRRWRYRFRMRRA